MPSQIHQSDFMNANFRITRPSSTSSLRSPGFHQIGVQSKKKFSGRNTSRNRQVYIHDGQPTPLRWHEHKLIIREAARRARNRDLLNDSASNSSRLQALATTARALWFNDVALLERLSVVSPVVREHVNFVSGSVSLIDPCAFDEQVSESRRAALDRAADRLSLDSRSCSD